MGTTTDNYQRKKKTFKVTNEEDGTFREIIPQKIWNTEEGRIK